MTDDQDRAAGSAADENNADSKSGRIRALNDRFRTTLIGGRVMATAGVAALGAGRVQRLLARVRAFDAFDRDNDP